MCIIYYLGILMALGLTQTIIIRVVSGGYFVCAGFHSRVMSCGYAVLFKV